MFLLLGAAAVVWADAPGKVFKVDGNSDARRKKSVAYVLSLSEEKALAIVPEQSGFYFVDCPNCNNGAQDRAPWVWTPENPRQIKCGGCGAVYPDNPKYPDKEFVSVKAPKGAHKYHYYKGKREKRYFFRGAADYWARDYMAKVCRDLAELYWTTKDERYARRAALILERFAKVYPTWAYKFDYPFRPVLFSPHNKNRIQGVGAYRVSRWSWWAYMGVSNELLQAYDCLRFWPGLDKLAKGRARKRIEKDLLGGMVEFAMGFEEQYSNMSPTLWRSVLYAGRVLNEPEWILETLKRVNHFMATRLLYDGHWFETAPAYCGQVVGSMKATLDILGDYAPPEGEAAQFVKSSVERARTQWGYLNRSNKVLRFPNGGLPTINDTWARKSAARKATESLLMPGLGLGILGGGAGEDQIYCWLNYTSGIHHKHHDALSMGLFAYNEELLRDMGYTHTAWRIWTLSMMSHNTVVVNGVESAHDKDHKENRLRAWATDKRGFHLVEAESDSAYGEATRRFRRTLALVGADSRDAYLIDVFQVQGGDQHDYLLHGVPTEDSTAAVIGAALTPFQGTLMNPGTKFAYPEGESYNVGNAGAYGFVKRIKSGKAAERIALDLRLTSRPSVGSRSALVCRAGDTVYLGEAPRIRQAERKDNLLDKFYAPFFCLRRTGKNLKSVFIAVHEPVNGEPKLKNVTATDLKGGVLVTVDRGRHGRDYFVMGLDGAVSAQARTEDGALRIEGAYGLARTRDGACVEAHLVGGQALRLGDMKLTGAPGWSGVVRGVSREATKTTRGSFDVAETLAPEQEGAALLIEFADRTVRGYNIAKIEPLAQGSRIHVVEDPGYVVKGGQVELVTFPQRKIKGARVDYLLHGVAHWRKP